MDNISVLYEAFKLLTEEDKELLRTCFSNKYLTEKEKQYELLRCFLAIVEFRRETKGQKYEREKGTLIESFKEKQEEEYQAIEEQKRLERLRQEELRRQREEKLQKEMQKKAKEIEKSKIIAEKMKEKRRQEQLEKEKYTYDKAMEMVYDYLTTKHMRFSYDLIEKVDIDKFLKHMNNELKLVGVNIYVEFKPTFVVENIKEYGKIFDKVYPDSNSFYLKDSKLGRTTDIFTYYMGEISKKNERLEHPIEEEPHTYRNDPVLEWLKERMNG